MRVLHVAPHPDDELIGAPASLLAMRDRGHEIVNLAATLGSRQSKKAKRLDELKRACEVVRFKLVVADASNMSELKIILKKEAKKSDLLVAPSPHDAHPTHEWVARSVLQMACKYEKPLWLYGLWADLAFPTILHPFDQIAMSEILRGLKEHQGEMKRNDYRRLVKSRAEMNAILGPERVFGFGSKGIAAPYAEILTELVPADARMRLGPAHFLKAKKPLKPGSRGPLGPDLYSFFLGQSPRTEHLG